MLNLMGVLKFSLFAAVVLFSNPGTADVLNFRVAFENVPGAAQIEAGNLAAGMQVIEERLHRDGSESRGAMLATLCAAYIINDSLHKAENTCNQAVATEPTAAAYNNREVFSASAGDYFGGALISGVFSCASWKFISKN